MCWEAGLSHNILPESLRRMRERQDSTFTFSSEAQPEPSFDDARDPFFADEREYFAMAQRSVHGRWEYVNMTFDHHAYAVREGLARRRREAWLREADEARARHEESVRQARLAKQRADAFLFEIDTEMSATVPLAPSTLRPRERPMTRQPERWANAGAA